jgi:hypothetical protein
MNPVPMDLINSGWSVTVGGWVLKKPRSEVDSRERGAETQLSIVAYRAVAVSARNYVMSWLLRKCLNTSKNNGLLLTNCTCTFSWKNNCIASRFKWQSGILPISSQGLYPTFTTNLSRSHRVRTQGVSVSVCQDKFKSCLSASSSPLCLNSNFMFAMLFNLPIGVYTFSNQKYRLPSGDCYMNLKFRFH